MIAAADVCAHCNGTGWAPLPPPVNEVLKEGQAPTTECVTRCVCFWTRVTRQRLTGAGIPTKHQHGTFENYLAYNDTLAEALSRARAFADAYEPGSTKGLMFVGPAGVGKTHLAAAILTRIITRTKISGIFYKTRDLLRVLRGSYDREIRTTEAQVLNPILTCDLLVLDDLGAERTTDWVDDVMNSIVDTRYSMNRPMICTSNFPDLDDPEEINGLLYRVGFRMQSRLREMCTFITLDGADYRDTDGSEAELRRAWKQRRAIQPSRDLRRGPRPTPKDGKADLKWSGGKGGNQ